jgi:hypothetical protein
MAQRDSDPLSRPAWHALLGPLPPDAIIQRQPVASAEILASPTGAAIAGWEQLVLNLSAGSAGLRNLLVVLDDTGALLSASDSVLYHTGAGPGVTGSDAGAILQLSIGGRFEDDGSFHGTRWHSVAFERDRDEPQWESTPSEPSPEDVEGLRTLVQELMRRAERR